MTDRVFVDTNVWVYAVDAGEPAKQAVARALLAGARSELVLSAQVLGEFYVTATRKLAAAVEPQVAARMVSEMARLPVVPIDAESVRAAVSLSEGSRMSYWDALIVTSAQAAGCTHLLSEDLADGATDGRVRVRDPFGHGGRVSEEPAQYESRVDGWSDEDLHTELGRYETACRDAGMRPNAVHSYWDYARRFLAWRTGDYRPRGTPAAGRPVAHGRVSSEALEEQASAYARAIAAAGREQATVDTYHRHAMFFVRWLRGAFEPGARLR